MKYKLFNATTKNWVKDADSDEPKDCEYDTFDRAQIALDGVNQLKQLNPKHKDDRIVIIECVGPFGSKN